MTGQQRPYVVHVTADHPDSVQPDKTPVIQRLVELASDGFDQKVVSLNRVNPPKSSWLFPTFGLHIAEDSEAVEVVQYSAPPAGLHHRRMLLKLGERIADRLASERKPDLLMGHKLTIEGIAVARAAELLGVPYGLSIQGNTDARILRLRRDLHRSLAQVYHNAAITFPFTPWARDVVEGFLGKRSGPVHLLPCPMARDIMLPPTPGGTGLVSAFHLRNYRLKNLPCMATALQSAREGNSDLTLSIIGGGSQDDERAVRRLPGDGLIFEGAIPNERIAGRFNEARGFIMPSQRESFGLVFLEALFAGLPIAYPAGTAVDGYFNDCPFALRVDATDRSAIAHAMQILDRDEESLKASLAEWQRSDDAKRFTRAAIGSVFKAGLAEAIAQTDQGL